MELFRVKNVNSLEIHGSFNNKMEAKKVRDEKNAGLEVPVYVVSPGKDHVGKHGIKTKKNNRPSSAQGEKYEPGIHRQ